MAGNGTGYPNWFACAKARRIYYGNRASKGEPVDRTRAERARHVITLTGRTRPAASPGKGHPRKSNLSREYRCSCGHVGWSSHVDLERMEASHG